MVECFTALVVIAARDHHCEYSLSIIWHEPVVVVEVDSLLKDPVIEIK